MASDSGNVTTYRPEHVVNRADRTPVAVGPRQIRTLTMEDARRDKPSIFQSGDRHGH